jgi:glycine/D-amino acid oxidase-like deaminating enzyme
MSHPQTADVVVIGGGIRGCTMALFLAREGLRVTLVERGFLSFMASSANGGQVNVTDKSPDYYTALSLRSARMYPEFVASLDKQVFLQQKGILHVATNEEDLKRIRQRVQTLRQVPGLRVELVDGREAKEIVPGLTPEVIGGYVSPDDGLVEVLNLLPALARTTRREGVTLLHHTEVNGIALSGDRVEKVVTTRGDIATPVVVNAAGVFVPSVGRMVGISIPVEPEHGHLVITQPYAPIVPIPTEYIAQWPSGTIMLGTTNNKIGYDMKVRPLWLPPFVQEAVRILPELSKVRAMRIFAHIRPMPPDRLPIYDGAPAVKGFYVAVGHSGITLAPVTGKIFADLIVRGETDIDLSPYSLKRFANPSKN